jgi:hypothetical protein
MSMLYNKIKNWEWYKWWCTIEHHMFPYEGNKKGSGKGYY